VTSIKVDEESVDLTVLAGDRNSILVAVLLCWVQIIDPWSWKTGWIYSKFLAPFAIPSAPAGAARASRGKPPGGAQLLLATRLFRAHSL
jgi:hypothetical protein